MIIVKILGGFASQFNKYAWTKKLADALGAELCIDISEYVQGYFRPFMLEYLCIDDCKVISDISLIEHVIKVNDGDQLLQYYNSGANLYIYKEEQDYEAFFKTYPEYRIDSSWEVFQKLRLKKESNFVTSFQNEIKDVYSIAVHIRRGDFVTLGFNDQIDEYQAAIGYVIKRNQNARIYFFSNDIEWVKEQFGANDQFYYINNENGSLGDIEDFLCMAACNLRILSSLSGYGKLANMLSKTLRADSDGAISLQQDTWEQDICALNDAERKAGMVYFNNHITSNIPTCNLIENKVKETEDIPKRKKESIILITQESRIEWMYDKCFLVAMLLAKKGYKVLYLNIDKNAESGDLCVATNMDGQSLGFSKINSKIGTNHMESELAKWMVNNDSKRTIVWDYKSFEFKYVITHLRKFLMFWVVNKSKKYGKEFCFKITPELAERKKCSLSEIKNEQELIKMHEECYSNIIDSILVKMKDR